MTRQAVEDAVAYLACTAQLVACSVLDRGRNPFWSRLCGRPSNLGASFTENAFKVLFGREPDGQEHRHGDQPSPARDRVHGAADKRRAAQDRVLRRRQLHRSPPRRMRPESNPRIMHGRGRSARHLGARKASRGGAVRRSRAGGATPAVLRCAATRAVSAPEYIRPPV